MWSVDTLYDFYDWKLYVVYPLKQLVCDSALIGNLPLWFLLCIVILTNLGFDVPIKSCV